MQTLPFSQSPEFHAPVMYSFFSGIGKFFEDAGKTFVGGFEKFGEGISTGNFEKIVKGIGGIAAPGIVTGANALSSPTPEFSHSPDMSLYSELTLL
jgi:hypothetical protein